MRERYQGGSLAGFIIIGAVLALVLVGGLYGLNRYNAEQSKEVATDQNDGSDKKTNDKTPPESDSEPKPESTKKDDQASSNDTSEPAAANPPSDKKLPATGPADTLAAIVAIGALGFAATHYLQSRSRNNR